MDTIKPHKTAMTRNKPSLPLKLAIQKGFIQKDTTILDYGSGKGFDVKYLESLGIPVASYDKYFQPTLPEGTFHTVFLSYVLNVIVDRQERETTLCQAFSKATDRLIVSVRTYRDLANVKTATPYLDGYITSANTFQHFFMDYEIERILFSLPGTHKRTRLANGVYAVEKL